MVNEKHILWDITGKAVFGLGSLDGMHCTLGYHYLWPTAAVATAV